MLDIFSKYLAVITREDLIREFSKQKLLNKSMKSEINLGEILNNKLIGFFFNANWCNPGKTFCDELLNPIYNQSVSENLNFQVIYVSLDNSSNDICFQEHPDCWLYWPLEKITTKYFYHFLLLFV